MIINEAILVAVVWDRGKAEGEELVCQGDKVRRIEDDVKNKRSVFTTVWNWTASLREKWGSPTVPGKWYCMLRAVSRSRQRGCTSNFYTTQDARLPFDIYNPLQHPPSAGYRCSMLVKRRLNNGEEETNFTLDLLSDLPRGARFLQTIHQ